MRKDLPNYLGKSLLPLTVASAILLSCSSQSTDQQLATVRLHAQASAVTPGQPVDLAIVLQLARGWHTYWLNPGDAGLAPQIEWRLPDGWRLQRIEFPIPRRFEDEGIVSLGYSGQAVLMARLLAPRGVNQDSVALHMQISYLVCKEECIPLQDSATIVLPVSTASPTPANRRDVALFERAAAALPDPGTPLSAQCRQVDDNHLRLVIDPAPEPLHAPDISFFPLTEGVIDLAAQPTVVRNGSALELILPLSRLRSGPITEIKGLVAGVRRNGLQPAFYIEAFSHD